MELTPLEKFNEYRAQRDFQAKAVSALMDLIERGEESKLQIKYHTQLSTEEQDAERAVTKEAIKDLRAINAAIALLCENFGIEA